MAQTVTANGLTISHKGTAGFEINSTPDVCKTPAGSAVVPVPYVIIARSSTLSKGTKKVKADGGNSIAHRPSVHARCNGDEPGTLKGIISNTNIDKSHWITFSPTVYAEGKNISRLSDKMFMNNRNCISGVGGHFEIPHMPGTIMFELCQIFCEARKEWHDCKASGKPKCDKPSKIAERKTKAKLGKPGSGLNNAIDPAGKGRVGSAEKTFFANTKGKNFKGLRKVYDEKSLKRALKRQLRKEVRQGLTKKGAKMLLGGWKKLIPGLNVASTVYDIVDTGMMVREIYKSLNAASVMQDAIKIKPDFAIQNPDGSVADIYDFKFDDPKTGYQDKFQSNGQEAAYKNATGKKPISVDASPESCNCDGGAKKPPAVPLG